jgi:hypothetical protein
MPEVIMVGERVSVAGGCGTNVFSWADDILETLESVWTERLRFGQKLARNIGPSLEP